MASRLNFLTTKQASEEFIKAGLKETPEDISLLARNGAFPGARKNKSNAWSIPVEDVKSVIEKRTKRRRSIRQIVNTSGFLVGFAAVIAFIANISQIAGSIRDFFGGNSSPISVTVTIPTPIPLEPVAPTPIPTPPPAVAGKSRITIADFEDKSGTKLQERDLAGYIYDELSNRIKEGGLPIELYRLHRAVDENTAVSIGKESGCSILIWGWYDKDVLSPKIERIATTHCEPIKDIKDLFIGEERQDEVTLTLTNGLPKEVAYFSLLAMASDRYSHGDYDNSLSLLNKLLVDFNGCSGLSIADDAFRLRGDIYKGKYLFKEALQEYSCAVLLDEKNPKSFERRAIIYEFLGDKPNAKKDYNTIVNLYTDMIAKNPLDYTLIRGKAQALMNTGRIDDAVSELEVAIITNSDKSIAHLDLGYAYMMSGKYEDAIRETKLAIGLDKNSLGGHTNLASIYVERQQEGDLESALTSTDEALKINPTCQAVISQRGHVFVLMHNYEEAIIAFKKEISLAPGYYGAYRDLGYAYRLRNSRDDIDFALDNFNTAIKLNPDDIDSYYNRGLAYNTANDSEKAINDFSKVVLSTKAGERFHDEAAKELIGFGVNP